MNRFARQLFDNQMKGPKEMRLAARIFAAGLLAFGLGLGPAVAASASSGVTVTWVTYTGSYSHTYSCSGTATYYGWDVSYVSNGCGDRVWLHAQENGGGAAYCVNPGAQAYGAIGNYEQIFISTNPLPCDYGVKGQVAWEGQTSFVQTFVCSDGYTNNQSPQLVGAVYNPCQVRIWVHDSRGNAIQCVTPHSTYQMTAQQFTEGPVQFQISYNQAPC
jgi:hypothetical protein